MAKFVVYEKVSEAIYRSVDKNTASGGTQTAINLGSGLIAGFAAALVSQPADTMLSKINKTKGLPGEGTTSRLIKIAKELGFRGSYSGIGARLFMGEFYTSRFFSSNANLAADSGYFDCRSIRHFRRHQEGAQCHRRCRTCQIDDLYKYRSRAVGGRMIPRQP